MAIQTSRTTYHHKNLRNALIEAASSMLQQTGSAALSMRELAQITGVSHSAPYRHFANKDELLAAVAANGYAHIRSVCEQAATMHADQPLKALEDAGIGYLLFVFHNPEVANLMFSGTLPVDSWPDELSGAAQSAVNALACVIELGKQQGLYADFPTEELTLTSLATVHGLAMFMNSGLLHEQAGNETALRKLGKRLAQVLIYGMLRR